jgi:Pectate lyase superfamily protein
MPYSGDTYSLPAGTLAVNGAISDATTHQSAPFTDIEAALTVVKTSLTSHTHPDTRVLDVTKAGVLLTGQTAADRTTAMNAALVTAAADGRSVYIPAGQWWFSSAIMVPENTRLMGAGQDRTILRLDATAVANANLMSANGVSNFIVTDLTLDGNVERLAVRSGTGAYAGGTLAANATAVVVVTVTGVTPASTRLSALCDTLPNGIVLKKVPGTNIVTVTILNTTEASITVPALTIRCSEYTYSVSTNTVGCSLGILAASNGLVERVTAKNAAKHSCDVSGSVYSIGPGTIAGDAITYYPPSPARNIIIRDCIFTGGGDDNWTSHGVENVWIDRCVSHSSNGTLIPTNSNAYEVDDASRNVWLTDCHGYNVINGIEVKAHDFEPAANHVFIKNFIGSYCETGFDCHHTAHGDTAQPISPTGGRVVIDGMILRNCTDQYFRVLAYRAVYARNIILRDNGLATSNKPFAVENGANRVVVDGLELRGFATTVDYGVFIQSSTASDVSVSNVFIDGVGRQAGVYVGSGVQRVTLKNIRAVAPASLAATNPAAFWIFSGMNNDIRATGLTQTGYPQDIRTGSGATFYPITDMVDHPQWFKGNIAFGDTTATRDYATDSLEGLVYINGEAVTISRNGGTVMSLNRQTNNGPLVRFQRSGIDVGDIEVTATDAIFNTASDQDLKDDDGLIEPALMREVIRLVRIHNFRWKVNGHADAGVFAQELYKVWPKAVTPGGEIMEGKRMVKTTWKVDYSKLVIPLIAAWQDVDYRLSVLEAKS